MRFRTEEREDPRPNITPLVDILFLLIIFFTVTTTFANTGGIDVNLPEASSQRQIEKVDKMFVVINKEGQAFIEGEHKTDAQLAESMSKLAANNKEALVIIEADKDTTHGRVVAVMDTAQSAGLKRLAIATEQPPGEQPRVEDGSTAQ